MGTRSGGLRSGLWDSRAAFLQREGAGGNAQRSEGRVGHLVGKPRSAGLGRVPARSCRGRWPQFLLPGGQLCYTARSSHRAGLRAKLTQGEDVPRRRLPRRPPARPPPTPAPGRPPHNNRRTRRAYGSDRPARCVPSMPKAGGAGASPGLQATGSSPPGALYPGDSGSHHKPIPESGFASAVRLFPRLG